MVYEDWLIAWYFLVQGLTYQWLKHMTDKLTVVQTSTPTYSHTPTQKSYPDKLTHTHTQQTYPDKHTHTHNKHTQTNTHTNTHTHTHKHIHTALDSHTTYVHSQCCCSRGDNMASSAYTLGHLTCCGSCPPAEMKCYLVSNVSTIISQTAGPVHLNSQLAVGIDNQLKHKDTS